MIEKRKKKKANGKKIKINKKRSDQILQWQQSERVGYIVFVSLSSLKEKKKKKQRDLLIVLVLSFGIWVFL